MLSAPLAPELALDVPFQKQDEFQCGAAALGMVLRYWQIPADPAALETELFVPALQGTPPALIADAARQRGLLATCRRASMRDLQSALRAGQPPIVFLGPDRTGSPGHFAVVTGLRGDGDRIRLHGPQEPNVWWHRRAFQQRWNTGHRLALFCHPPGAATNTPPSG
jgi:ABC-type bacteriocin/lantibiotic exporter with double-glycine peptidase domain